MIFSTQNAFGVEKKDVAYLDGGIHEDALFVGVRKEKSTNGNLFIEFEFSKEGSKLTHTEWEPNKNEGQSDEDFNSKANNQVARILQIMGVFYSKEELQNFTFETFDTLYSWVKSLMDVVDKTKKLRIKAVYGQSGFTSLPKYAKYTFIESMDIPKDKSKIKELAIDTFKRPQLGDTEVNSQSSANVFGAKVEAAATPF
jgi:hypothetical protein